MSGSPGPSDEEPDPPYHSNPQLEAASIYADRLLEFAEHGVTDVNALSGGVKEEGLERSLEEKLLELHIEESLKERLNWSSHLNPCSNLLSLLCKRERCHRLIVELLPGEYVLTACTKDGNSCELARLPYNEDAFLTHVDNQELPAFLIDLLETACPNGELFYAGCIIAEVHDERRERRGEVTHVLLRPTTHTIICDSNVMANQLSAAYGRGLTPEERSGLEGQLLLATEPNLCLDPDPVVSVLARKAAFHRQKFATVPMRRRKNRKRKLEDVRPPPELKLYDFIRNNMNKDHHKMTPQEALLKHQAHARAKMNSIENQEETATDLKPPSETDVSKLARAISKRGETNDNTPVVLEEYILETAERGTQRIYHTRLTIFQRMSNDEYLGELYVERDFKENERKGSTCRFVLGTKQHALSYINQFTEIFTEEGRKSVKITHQVPNQEPRVTFTAGMRERMNDRAAQAAAQAGLVQNQVVVTAANTAPQQPVKRLVSGPSILQQTLTAAAVSPTTQPTVVAAAAAAGAASSPVVVRNLQQLPIHPVQTVRQVVAPQVGGILQSQLTNNQASNLLPVTPHPPSALKVENVVQNRSNKNDSDEQEMEISAIMESLIKDTAQFEAEKNLSSPGKPSSTLLAQLPTCPVPPASLATVVQVSPAKPVASAAAVANPKLVNRVSLQNLLSAQTQQQPQLQGNLSPAKVTVSQLAAQLQRPPAITQVSLPSYSQALAQSQQAALQQTSPSQRLVLAQQQPVAPTATTVGSMDGSPLNKSLEAPGLQALLANTPSADNPSANHDLLGNGCPSSSNSNVSGSSTLLERLVSGPPVVSTTVTPQTSVLRSSNAADSTNEITLAALLAKPAQRAANNGSTSPAKMSPLLQQLQQPIPPPRPISAASASSLPSPRQQMTSPRRPAASPSPRAAVRSPRPSPTNFAAMQQSPQRPQHQLMQPPGAKTTSLLSAQLQQPLNIQAPPTPVQEHQANGLNGQQNGVNGSQQSNVVIQNLVQCGMVQVSSGGQIVQPTPTNTTTASIPLQLQIPGISGPVTLSVNLPATAAAAQVSSDSQSNLTIQQKSKLVANNVLLQSSTGNIIQLPQQPIVTAVPHTNHLVKSTASGQVLQVRQTPSGQSVYVQVPTTQQQQSIQIVRSVPQPTIVRAVTNQQQSPQQQLLLNSSGIVNALKSPPSVSSATTGMLPTLSPAAGGSSAPGSVGTIPPSPVNSNAIMSPPTPQQLMVGQQDSSLVAIHLDNAHHPVLLSSPATAGNNPTTASNQLNHAAAQIKMRQHRKQSLK